MTTSQPRPAPGTQPGVAAADGSTFGSPLLMTRDEIDTSAVRAHCREAHHASRLPRANVDVATWHAHQHHRYSSSLSHIHRGLWVQIIRPGNPRGAGQVTRPLGWYTGQDAVSREQLREEWQAKLAAARRWQS